MREDCQACEIGAENVVPDKEEEAWFFGEGTESALNTFKVRFSTLMCP